jgi:hypothetical protein
MRRSPALLPARGWPVGTTIPADAPPDWRWRLTVLRDETPRAQSTHPERMPPPLPAFDATDPFASYDQVAAVHAQLALSPTEMLRTMVFPTNLGLIRFEVDGNDHAVVGELWTSDGLGSTEGGPFTRHRAALGLSPDLVAPQLEAVAGG